jgi:hypothetical protein
VPYQDLKTLKRELFDEDPEVAFAYFQTVFEEFLQDGTVSFQDVQRALNGWLERVGGADAFAKQHSLDVSAIERVAQSNDTNMPVIIVDQVLQAMGLKLTYNFRTVKIGIIEAFAIEKLNIAKTSKKQKVQPIRFQSP